MKFISFQLHEIAGGETIIIPTPESYKDVATLIKSDNFRKSGRVEPIWKIFLKTYKYPTLAAVFWMRVSSYKQGWLRRLSLEIQDHYRLKYGLSLTTTHVGYGLCLSHEYFRVTEHAMIGNNVNLSHFMTIGSNTGKGARIGNNVYIGPSVNIMEEVHIGSNTIIGAGSVVPKDIEADSTYVGNPAKKIGPNKHPEFIKNPWPLPTECQVK